MLVAGASLDSVRLVNVQNATKVLDSTHKHTQPGG